MNLDQSFWLDSRNIGHTISIQEKIDFQGKCIKEISPYCSFCTKKVSDYKIDQTDPANMVWWSRGWSV